MEIQMTVILVLLFLATFLTIDYVKTQYEHRKLDTLYRSERRGTMFTTPGFEMLGALAQDGGIPYEEFTEYGANI